MRLLLAEDHERFAVFVKEGLEKGGFTVDAVNCAGDGDAAMGTVDYDAVVLDLGLPDQDGLDILKGADIDKLEVFIFLPIRLGPSRGSL